MNTTKEKVQVIVLPTENRNTIYKDGLTGNLVFGKESFAYKHKLSKKQHLYIISDKKIKKNDWVLLTSKIMKAENVYEKYGKYIGKKVISTTDKKLNEQGIARPLEEWVEYYVEQHNKGNVITEVLVDYEKSLIITQNEPLLKHQGNKPQVVPHKAIKQLKVSKDNTITIHPINRQGFGV